MKSIGWWIVCRNVVPARFDKFHHCHQTFHLLCLWQYSSLIMSISRWTHQEMSSFFYSNRYWISLEELWWLFLAPSFPILFLRLLSGFSFFWPLQSSSKVWHQNSQCDNESKNCQPSSGFLQLMQHLQAKRIHI